MNYKDFINNFENKLKDIKENGEVFTPLKKVNEMLLDIPEEEWKLKNNKWLEPSNGIGNFSIPIFYKLML